MSAENHGPRVGAHRTRPGGRFTWRGKLLIWLGAVALLMAIGLLYLFSIRGDFTREPEVVLTPVTAPADAPEGTTIAVLNATGDEDVAQSVMARIADAGWEPGIVGDAAEPLDRTVVFYRGKEYQETALGIAQLLGTQAVAATESDLSGSPITVSVGQDADQLGLE